MAAACVGCDTSSAHSSLQSLILQGFIGALFDLMRVLLCC